MQRSKASYNLYLYESHGKDTTLIVIVFISFFNLPTKLIIIRAAELTM